MSGPEATLGTLTRGRTTARLLALLTSTPGQELHTRELVRRVGGTEHPVQRALSLLERQGLVESRRMGNLRLWRMPTTHPLYGTLRELFARTVGIADQLRTALADQPVDLAFIFGSYAAGGDDASSDIDLFVVGEVDWRVVKAVASDVLRRLGRELREVVWTKEELANAVRSSSPFLQTIRDESKIWVIGDDDAFERSLRDVAGSASRSGADQR